MANGEFTGEGLKVRFAKYLGDQAHFSVDGDLIAAGGGDTGAFLPSVLECKEAEECEAAGGFFGGIYSYYPALFAGIVERAIDLGEVWLSVHRPILSAPQAAVNSKRKSDQGNRI